VTNQPHEPNPEGGPDPAPQSYTQDIRHTAVSARVPEKVSRGVFATGTMILQTAEEFVIDFLAMAAHPQQIVARVVLTRNTFGQFIAALRANLGKYEQQFGRLTPHERAVPAVQTVPGATGSVLATPGPLGSEAAPPAQQPASPSPEMPAPPRVEELYDQLKLPDEMLGGAFANVVMIRHTPEEFCFDFIASFYPRSAVTSRVFMAAGRVPSFLDALTSSFRKYQERSSGQQPPPPPAAPASP
jgi:hypothetical protein